MVEEELDGNWSDTLQLAGMALKFIGVPEGGTLETSTDNGQGSPGLAVNRALPPVCCGQHSA